MSISTFSLPNGLKIIHLASSSHVVYCGFAVNAGARNETEQQFGLAHFVEHNLFKGTTKRRAWHILNRMETVGGELNAYTSKEETFLYSICLAEDTERAVELLSDLVFNSRFPDAEIKKEREVVIDEINSYEDTPSEQIFDDFEDMVFKNHPLGHNILGNTKSLASFDTKACLDFTSKFYKPDNMIFFIYGKIPDQQLNRLINKYFTPYSSPFTLHPSPLTFHPSPVYPSPQKNFLDKSLHQSHVIVGSRVCSTYDDRRTALQLLNNILGGPGMNSRLNIELREKRGLVYTVESSLNLYTDCGVFTVYFGCSHSDRDKCISLTEKEFKRLRDNRLTTTQFSSAVKQWKGQLGIAANNHENLALGLGKQFLRFGRYKTLEEVFKKIDTLTSDSLLEAANIFLDENRIFVLGY